MSWLRIAHIDPITVRGQLGDVSYQYDLPLYFLIGNTLLNKDGDIDTEKLFTYLWTNQNTSLDDTLDSLIEKISNADYMYAFCAGASRANGVYLLIKDLTFDELDLSEAETLDDVFDKISETLEEQISEVDWTGYLPPNQLEYWDDSPVNGWHYISMNPVQSTVRRTLAYTDYIGDSNTAITAPMGSGKDIEPVGYGDGWIVDKPSRRQLMWPKSLQDRLSEEGISHCDHYSDLGVYSGFFYPTWRGVSHFRKIENAMAWIPAELYCWPSSGLYKYYAAAGNLDEPTYYQNLDVPTGTFFPLLLPAPISAVGMLSSFPSILSIDTMFKDIGKTSDYSRPYGDSSDGNGVWHRMA